MPTFRLLILAFCLLSAAFGAHAQSDLAVGQVFDGRFHDRADATETLISGDALKPYNLSTFRSITITSDLADKIEPLVRRDGAKALSKEVKLKNGHIYGAFYELPAKEGRRRYIFYLNKFLNGGRQLMIIYIDGAATPDQVRKLL